MSEASNQLKRKSTVNADSWNGKVEEIDDIKGFNCIKTAESAATFLNFLIENCLVFSSCTHLMGIHLVSLVERCINLNILPSIVWCFTKLNLPYIVTYLLESDLMSQEILKYHPNNFQNVVWLLGFNEQWGIINSLIENNCINVEMVACRDMDNKSPNFVWILASRGQEAILIRLLDRHLADLEMFIATVQHKQDYCESNGYSDTIHALIKAKLENICQRVLQLVVQESKGLAEPIIQAGEYMQGLVSHLVSSKLTNALVLLLHSDLITSEHLDRDNVQQMTQQAMWAPLELCLKGKLLTRELICGTMELIDSPLNIWSMLIEQNLVELNSTLLMRLIETINMLKIRDTVNVIPR